MLRRGEQSMFLNQQMIPESTMMVPTAGLEPAQVAPLAPQTSASTNFATSAIITSVRARVPAAAPVYSQAASPV
jgi:hypothetical protein